MVVKGRKKGKNKSNAYLWCLDLMLCFEYHLWPRKTNSQRQPGHSGGTPDEKDDRCRPKTDFFPGNHHNIPTQIQSAPSVLHSCNFIVFHHHKVHGVKKRNVILQCAGLQSDVSCFCTVCLFLYQPKRKKKSILEWTCVGFSTCRSVRLRTEMWPSLRCLGC